MKRATVFVCLLVLLATPALLFGQTSTTAQISGVVADPSGAVVPGAEVELRNTATGVTQKIKTNAAGQYVFPGVRPGNYDLTVRMDGFRTSAISNIKVDVAKSYSYDVSMEIGAAVETVEVTAEGRVELQTTDATIGGVISGEPLLRLPNFGVNAVNLLTLQPGVIPQNSNLDANAGGSVTGARSDQSTYSLDGLDVSDNTIGQFARTIVPTPLDSIEEFRFGVTNPNATFQRASGGQVAMVTRSGGNKFHGAVYWYHNNDNINANTWTNNRTGVRKAERKDNRYGFRVGGPIWKDKTFFFFNFEGRRFPRSTNVVRNVPTDTLRQGIIRFEDATGTINSYNLASSTLCGATNTTQCDPRMLGISPSVQALWSSLPLGNDTSLGDGLNRIGFRSTIANPLETDYFMFRLDHNFTQTWRFNGSFRYFDSTDISSGQLDIRGGVAQSAATTIGNPRNLQMTLVGQITPRLTSSFTFGWLYDKLRFNRSTPTNTATLLGLTGTDTSAGFVAIDAFGTSIDEPIDIDTQRARNQGRTPRNYQFNEDVTWVKGKHTFQFGGNLRLLKSFDFRNDKVVGSLSSLVSSMADGSFISIPSSARPPTCPTGSTTATNCLPSGRVSAWNNLYSASLGMIDNTSILVARDGALNTLPFGSGLEANSKLPAYELYGQDVWRLSPSFTLTLGLAYQWQTPPEERDGKNTFIIDNTTGEIINTDGYLRAKAAAALAGSVFNPQLAYLPINSSNRSDIFDTDWNNWSPRLAAAWNPSFSEGVLGKLFGERKTVLRGGAGISYDRLNTVQTIIIPQLGVGFAQTLSCNGPRSTGTCGGTGANPSNAFRVGRDGSIPLPVDPGAGDPIVPNPFFSELLSFQVDPTFDVGENYSLDFSVQRELPWDMIGEVAWVARFGRRLNQSKNLNAVPYFHVDPASGQTFAQAFDSVATQLRNGVSAASVTPQAWFENQVAGNATSCLLTYGVSCTNLLADAFSSEFVNGNLGDLFITGIDIERFFNGLPSISNLQVLELFMRTDGGLSNYHGLLFTLRKRMSHGLAFDINYSLSKSLDQVGAVANTAGYFPTPYFEDVDYGPSFFDRTHIINANAYYELPFGRGRHFSTGNWTDKVIGGWYVSGIATSFSGLAQQVDVSDQTFGGGVIFAFFSGAVPLANPSGFGGQTASGVTGSNGIGTTGGGSGSGINLFRDPAAVFDSFRHVLLSQDGRAGRANPFRGPNFQNLDFALGKKTSVTESVNILFQFDFFNIFNKVNFNDPSSISLLNPTAFGVITSQFTPGDRSFGSRTIQFSFRVEF